ncbi:MAG: hypothetical protein ABH829_02075 [archaeon]
MDGAEKKCRTHVNFVMGDALELYDIPAAKAHELADLLLRFFRVVYKYDEKFECMRSASCSEFGKEAGKMRLDIGRFLAPGAESQAMISRVEELFSLECTAMELRRKRSLDKKTAMRMMVDIWARKHCDFDICFRLAEGYGRVQPKCLKMMREFLRPRLDHGEFVGEMDDFYDDSKCGLYNSLVLAKELGLGAEFILGRARQDISEMKKWGEMIKGELGDASRTAKYVPTAIEDTEKDFRKLERFVSDWKSR